MRFENSDFSSTGDKVDILVIKEANHAPLNISIHPLTIGQYQGLNRSGSTECVLTSSDNAAEGKAPSTKVNKILLEALAISPDTK